MYAVIILWSLKVGRQKKGVVETFVINPKSVSLGNLYGEIDAASFEWTDGFVARSFRNFSKKYSVGNRETAEKEDVNDDAASVEVAQSGITEDVVTTIVDSFITGTVHG
jgi:hypothetical protein